MSLTVIVAISILFKAKVIQNLVLKVINEIIGRKLFVIRGDNESNQEDKVSDTDAIVILRLKIAISCHSIIILHHKIAVL